MPGRQVFKDRIEVESKHISEFDYFGGHDEFAVVSESIQSQKLKIWTPKVGVDSAKQAKEKYGMDYIPLPANKDETITCLNWINGENLNGDGKKRKATNPSVLAIGHASGLLVLYSPAFSKTLRSVKDAVSSAINCMASSKDGQRLYLSSSTGEVAMHNLLNNTTMKRWNARSSAISSIKLLRDESVLAVAQHDIQLWDVANDNSTPELLLTLPGHATTIESMAVYESSAEDQCLLFTCASNDRFIYCWKVANDVAKTAPVALFSLSSDHIPLQIRCGAGLIGALCENTTVTVWSIEQSLQQLIAKQQAKRKRAQRTFTPQTTIASANVNLAILNVKFNGPGSLLVAEGLPLKPHFGCIRLRDNDDKFRTQIALEEQSTNLILTSDSSENGIARASVQEAVGAADGSLAKKATLDSSATLEDKMKKLGLLQDGTGINQAAGPKKQSSEVLAAEDSFELSEKNLPNAASLHQLATQAVQSGDAELLEKCLQVSSTKIIESTVSRLDVMLIIPLLEKLVVRFQSRPARGSSLLVWMRAVLVHHMNYLLTVPDLLQQLSGLYRSLEARTTIYQKMMRLSGRLDLVLNQMELRRRVHASGKTEFDETQRTVLYDENVEDTMSSEEFLESEDGDGSINSDSESMSQSAQNDDDNSNSDSDSTGDEMLASSDGDNSDNELSEIQ